MTPRQEAAARKRIAKLYQMKARAEAPLQKRLDANGSAFRKACEKLRKLYERKAKPIAKRLEAVDRKFEKRISTIARKL